MSPGLPSVHRRLSHRRSITCEGFVCDDGSIELEGLLLDTKPVALALVNREVAAGDPIHQMRLRLKVGADQRIVAAQALSEHHPYPACSEVQAGYGRLVGLRIERGFSREARRLLGGVHGCTHLGELLGRLAATYFQVLWADHGAAHIDQGEMTPLGGCHALRPEGEIVQRYFPQFKGTTGP